MGADNEAIQYIMKLHPDQEPFVAGIREAMRKHKAVLGQAATGYGKTFISGWMIRQTVERGNDVIFCVHRHQLLTQTSRQLKELGIEHQFIAPGVPYDPNIKVSVAMLQTLVRRKNKLKPPKLLINDEAHISASRTGSEIIDWVKSNGGWIIGITATPRRTDGKGLGKHYDIMIKGPSTKWLIENNRLSPYDIYGPDLLPDLKSVPSRAGDWQAEALEVVLNKTTITGSAIEMYRALADGEPCIVFCITVKHAYDVARDFCDAGYRFVAVDAQTPNRVRERAISDLANGNIHGICNVALFVEGLDVPAATCAILLNATKSIIKFRQSVGRVLRYVPGKRAKIIDHVGNVFRHDLPCADIDWTLEDAPKKSRAESNPISLSHCKSCRAIFPAALPVCPRCGEEKKPEEKKVNTRKGRLRKITEEDMIRAAQEKLERKKEEWAAKTYDDFLAIGERRGYNNPSGWAFLKFKLYREKYAKRKNRS